MNTVRLLQALQYTKEQAETSFAQIFDDTTGDGIGSADYYEMQRRVLDQLITETTTVKKLADARINEGDGKLANQVVEDSRLVDIEALYEMFVFFMWEDVVSRYRDRGEVMPLVVTMETLQGVQLFKNLPTEFFIIGTQRIIDKFNRQ